jgi:DnaK suppressor protein
LAEVESRELVSIENALERMREGNYGTCAACAESIPLARLQALPYATNCIRCQREAEKGKLERDAPDWGRVVDRPVVEREVVIGDLELDVS